jgi:hypothetical protein
MSVLRLIVLQAKTAINAFVADVGESCKCIYSDRQRFNIICKQQHSCTLRVLANRSKNKGISDPTGHSTISNASYIE